MDLDLNPFILIFAIASIVAILAKRMRLPFTIALVIAGIVVAGLGLKAPFELGYDLIFHVLLPPLLFEGALHMRLSHLKENSKVILLLVLPGLMISIFMVAFFLNLFFPFLPLVVALLLAAIVIPTDPASILAFYREMKVPKKLRSIVEGESVFDDGLAIVMFNVILTVIIASAVSTNSINVDSQQIWDGVGQFISLSAVGISLGVGLGYFAYLILKRIDDTFTEVMITVILAFGIFAAAEAMNGSGVFAVVVSGLLLGNYGTRFAMAPSTRMSLLSFWSFLAFAVNSFLFILIGMSVSWAGIWENIYLIIFTILLLWFARAIMIFAIGKIVNKKKKELPRKWQFAMWWGGLRGAIPIAMALSIPIFIDEAGTIPFPHRETILAVTFGAVLGTLLIQGFSLRPMLKSIGFTGTSIKDAEKEEKEISVLLRDAMDELATLRNDGEMSDSAYSWLVSKYGKVNSILLTELGMLVKEHGFIPKEEYVSAVREALQSKKDAVKEAWEGNIISGSVGERLLMELGTQIASLSTPDEGGLKTPVELLRSVTRSTSEPNTQTLERTCGICLQPIGPGESTCNCRCGTIFHNSCLGDIERCPICIAVLDKDVPVCEI